MASFQPPRMLRSQTYERYVYVIIGALFIFFGKEDEMITESLWHMTQSECMVFSLMFPDENGYRERNSAQQKSWMNQILL